MAKEGKAAKKKPKKSLTQLEAQADELRAKLAKVEDKIAVSKGLTPGVSPFAQPFPDLPEVKGVRFAAVEAGVKYDKRLDVMLAEMAPGTAMAGVFTRSATRSAPVDWCRKALAGLKAKQPKGPLAIVVNSGNANAFTGKGGMAGVEATAKAAAKALKTAASGVFISSTGVIGEALPAEKIAGKMEELATWLTPDAIRFAAEAIMTTDTFPKGAGRVIDLDGTEIAIAGIAKGSGMIAPDMATMLAYIFTDAPIRRPLLQSMLNAGVKTSFNAVTVDSDTSTSDTVLVAASGGVGGRPIASRRDPRAAVVEAAINDVLQDLAKQIVRDGEGASKIISVNVSGAKSDRSAQIIARAIANSPLVKTAVAGEDANWGRVVMAVGKSGQPADRDRLTIRFGDILVADKGWVADGYKEMAGAAYMKRDEIEIGVDLGVGEGRAVVWTCDLTHGYISINADYRS